MKSIHIYLSAFFLLSLSACKKNHYADGTASPIIAVVDVKALYKGTDVALTTENMGGAKQIVGVVISDAASGNAPAGILVVQNQRRNALRGLGINIGSAVSKYVVGDSVIVQIAGTTLTKVNGSMQITGATDASVTKVASNSNVRVQAVNAATIAANPDAYDNTLVTVAKAVTEPEAKPGDTYAGNKVINDGFGKLTLHTEAGAKFAASDLPASANFTGLLFNNAAGTDAISKIQLWPRTIDDAFPLAILRPSAIIITGYLTDPSGSDANYEYIQFLATKDIDFSVTPFSVVATNNAGTNPAPATGWAVGGARTYKINLTSGRVTKGKFFYVGGNKNIWGAGSTDISAATWISSTQYSNIDGAGFGTATANLLANSGNVAGIAVFNGTTVDFNSVPLDVIFYGGTGTVYSAGPPEIGYRITNTDYYSTINSVTRATQNFYGAGTNTQRLSLPVPTGTFSRLGGVYDAASGRWVTGRVTSVIALTATSTLTTIEGGTGFTTLQN